MRDLREKIEKEYGKELRELFNIQSKNDEIESDYESYIDNLVDMIMNNEITIEEIFWKRNWGMKIPLFFI